MLKLIAFDLDGTILRDNKELSRRSLEANIRGRYSVW